MQSPAKKDGLCWQSLEADGGVGGFDVRILKFIHKTKKANPNKQLF